jgi:hypothetical protein
MMIVDINGDLGDMFKFLQRLWNGFATILQTAWNVLCGLLSSIASLFGFRRLRPSPAHDNIVPDDVDAALDKARADQAQAQRLGQELHLDAALDLIWHYVNAPVSNRPWIDLSPLDEKQRMWLLSLPDAEIRRLAAAGRMAVVEATLFGRSRPQRRQRHSRGSHRQAPDAVGTATPVILPTKAQQVRHQLISRAIGSLGHQVPAWSTPQSDNASPAEPPAVEQPTTGHPFRF